MQAIMYSRYGSPDVLYRSEIAQPVPGENDVLLRVRAAGTNAGDWQLLRGKPFLGRPSFCRPCCSGHC